MYLFEIDIETIEEKIFFLLFSVQHNKNTLTYT